ncbi:MAG TPA: tail fiber domain-containing protein [Pyrinomonadaceae bacterium]
MTSALLLAGPAAAQNAAGQRAEGAAPVAASSTASGVRFVAPGQARRVRLEVYTAAGERLFDSGVRAGSILDWDGQGLADGSYLCVLTAEDLQGGKSRKLSSVTVQSGRAALGKEGEAELKTTYAQALDAAGVPRDEAVAAARAKKSDALTLTAHDGTDGQVTSTEGALTFRTGDVFSGKEREQMRVTPEGRVGIGTDKPEDALDVAGTIRARGGIRFDDGTVLTSANQAKGAGGGVATLNTTGTVPTANATGVGTDNKIAKWSDNTGTLTDSTFFEDDAGNVFNFFGSRVVAPGQQPFFEAQRSSGTDILQRFWNTGAGGAKLRYVAGAGATSQIQLTDATEWLSSIAGNNQIGLQFRVRPTNGTNSEAGLDASTRMTIARNGNVGIGTVAPAQRLEVAGSLKLSGTGSALIFPDGSSMTTAAAGGGGAPSGTSIITAINDPATVGVINDNRHSPNMARLNGANAWSGANVFGAGISANNALITNVGNPVNAGDAVNKAYTDANFVKFVPGAEQLSVGDANGTAPMINLRGGSTCCSGPGGHTPAWFKVFQNGSFVATGNLGIGVSPMQGKGYRTSWDSYKGAFRSGYADNEWDDNNVGFFSWAGGSNSTAIGLYALAFGDTNSAESTSSIVFGSGNQVKGAAGFSAGAGNRVCDTYGVAFGNNAISGGPIINGKCDPDTFNIRGLAAVAIGYRVTADQDHTTAMGKFATNNGFSGTFIWSDGSAQQTADTFRNTANNEFAARATGGFRFRTNLGGTTGCNLPAGSGVFNCTSSRATKENFSFVDGNDVLARLRKVPVSTWNYIAEGQQSRHLGPMAEDFYTAFQLGTTDKAIGIQDAVGVSLAAVKALDARTTELQQKTAEVEQLRAKVTTLEQRLAALEQLVQKQAESQQK